MPDTLFRVEPLVADRSGGRNWGIGGTGGVKESPLSFSRESWWFRAGSDWPATDGAIEGGVNEPLVGVRPLLASLEVSLASVADFSVLKLAFDRRLIDLRVNRLGAMAAEAGARQIRREADQHKGRRKESDPVFVCLIVCRISRGRAMRSSNCFLVGMRQAMDCPGWRRTSSGGPAKGEK